MTKDARLSEFPYQNSPRGKNIASISAADECYRKRRTRVHYDRFAMTSLGRESGDGAIFDPNIYSDSTETCASERAILERRASNTVNTTTISQVERTYIRMYIRVSATTASRGGCGIKRGYEVIFINS